MHVWEGCECGRCVSVGGVRVWEGCECGSIQEGTFTP